MTARSWLGLTALSMLMATSALAQTAAPAAVGRWTTIDDETKKPKSVISIYEEDGKLFGRIEKIFPAPGEPANPLCEKCDGALKNKPIIGMVILRDLKRDGNGWSGGKVLDPENGKTYKCKIEVEDGGKRLKVRGFVGFSLLGRTQHWVRTQDATQAPR